MRRLRLRSMRARIALLSLVILIEAAGVGGLVGVFWMIRIKDVVACGLSVTRSGDRLQALISLTGAESAKVVAGSVLHGDRNGDIIADRCRFRVTQVSRDRGAAICRADVECTDPADRAWLNELATSRRSERTRLWTRTRRVTSVLLNQMATRREQSNSGG